MRSEQELKEVQAKLSKLTNFISEFGKKNEFENKNFGYALSVQDTIYWVLGKITTEKFTGDGYLDVALLRLITQHIEVRTGQKLEVQE